MLGFIAATFLSMTVYTLWTNWTTLYIKETYGTTLKEANWLAPLPYLFAYAGGMFGGWLSLRWIDAGMEALAARRRACLVSAVALLATAAVPLMPTAVWGALAIAFSFFAISAWSVNLYTMPLDAFGMERAAFGMAVLTSAYGAMQTVISPLLGAMIDRYGYPPVLLAVSLLPLAAWSVLQGTARPA
jgi:MFS transporter, ACS family, hexuronate transporter